jgi:hypothetical protein
LVVQAAWVTLGLKTAYQKAVIDKAEEIVGFTGNLGIILPIYQALMDAELVSKAK